MNEVELWTEQVEKIIQYGMNEGYIPHDEMFCTLGYYLTRIFDLSQKQWGVEDALGILIDIQDEMIQVIENGLSFKHAVQHARSCYFNMCDELGVKP